ncbi:MAG: GNAT family N-acetyltransferase [Ignavibacteria bacterium RBG_13_36_8]|nr:MAG: GNAT family N-acetyltransferase [Ignavibacteria bacterium RBG_13_36_8]
MEYFLSSERLGWRLWSKDDFQLAKDLWGNYEVSKFIDTRGELSDDQILEKLKKEIETGNTHGLQYWPIFLLSNNEFVGCCGLRPYDADKRINEIGVHILPSYWRKGFAAEALHKVMDYAFNELKVTALFAGHNPKNDSSRSLLAKIGFRYTHDEFYPPTGLNHPSYLLTAEEYRQLKKFNK